MKSVHAGLPTASLPTAASPPRSDPALQALERHAWPEAFRLLRESDEAGDLTPEGLERLAGAASWVSRGDVALDALERAFGAYIQANRNAAAARVATNLAEENLTASARSVCNGWLKRADGLLADAPLVVEHGYLLRLKTRIAVYEDQDLQGGLRLVDDTLEIAEHFEDHELRVLAMQDRGHVLVLQGHVTAGMALIDESMVTALSEEFSPRVLGKTYCNMVSTCEKLADYRRAGEWSDRATRWCEPHGDSSFPGICGVHRAEVLRARGDWNDAKAHAEHAADHTDSHVVAVAAEAFYLIGEINLLRGEHVESEAAFQEAHQRGRNPLPGLAVLRLAQGRVDSARSLIDRALSAATELPLDRVRLLPAAVQIALASGDAAGAREQAAELSSLAETFGSPVFAASAAHAIGAVQLAEEDAENAMISLGRACALWHDAEMPYEEAHARVLLAEAYWKVEDSDNAELEAESARLSFERLGAVFDLGCLRDVVKLHD